jgi:hypothetical protein
MADRSPERYPQARDRAGFAGPYARFPALVVCQPWSLRLGSWFAHFEAAGREGTNPIGNRSLRRCRLFFFTLGSAVPFKASSASGASAFKSTSQLIYRGKSG